MTRSGPRGAPAVHLRVGVRHHARHDRRRAARPAPSVRRDTPARPSGSDAEPGSPATGSSPRSTWLRRGDLDDLVLECLAERTIALGQQRRLRRPRRRATIPRLHARFDPRCCRWRLRARRPGAHATWAPPTRTAGRSGHPGRCSTRSAPPPRSRVVTGDDVLDRRRPRRPGPGRRPPAARRTARSSPPTPTSAPTRSCRPCDAGADVVVTGRVADPVAVPRPARRTGSAGTSTTADAMAAGTLVGHLLECAGQLTGGYFADPGYQDVPDLARLGFPFAEVARGRDRRRSASSPAPAAASTGAPCGSSCSTRSRTRPRTRTPDVAARPARRSRSPTPDPIGCGCTAPAARRPAGRAQGQRRVPGRLPGRGGDLLRRPERRRARPAGRRRRHRSGCAGLPIAPGIEVLGGDRRLPAASRRHQHTTDALLDTRRRTRSRPSTPTGRPAAAASASTSARSSASLSTLIPRDAVRPDVTLLEGSPMLLHELAALPGRRQGQRSPPCRCFPHDDAALPAARSRPDRRTGPRPPRRYVAGEVVRYELPRCRALQFVCHQVLDGGVTTSLALDTHGKSLSSRLLSLEVARPG